jgi:hypothetical protein
MGLPLSYVFVRSTLMPSSKNTKKVEFKPPHALERDVKKVVRDLLSKDVYQFWPVPCGIGESSLDCIACVPVEITEEMVGKRIGVFMAIETKRPGKTKLSKLQEEATEKIHAAHGVAVMVNSIEVGRVWAELMAALTEMRTWS